MLAGARRDFAMKKAIFTSLFLTLVIFIVFPQYAFSHNSGTLTGTPNTYNVTFKKFEIRNTSGTWVVIKNEDQTFNIATVNAGAQIGSYASGNFSVGSYNRVRVTVSATFSIKGFVYDSGADRTYYTTSSGTNSVAGNKTEAEVNAYSDYYASPFTITDMTGAPAGDTLVNGDILHEDDDDFTITAGSNLTKTLYVDVTGTLQLQPDHILYPGPFTVDETP
jgi:hypothetical protein